MLPSFRAALSEKSVHLKSPSRRVLKLVMTTAYFLKKRTTKKACHRTSFQTARVRHMVRRKHRGELAPHTRNAYLPRSSPHYKEIPSCHFCGTIKEYRRHYPCTFTLYHIDAALSREIRTYVCRIFIKIRLLLFAFWNII